MATGCAELCNTFQWSFRTTFHCFGRNARLLRVPHRRITRLHGDGVAMCRSGVLVHCPSRLSAATAVLAAKLPCRDGVSAKYTLECAKAVHHFDRVMSHSFSVVAYPSMTPN